VSFHEGLLNFHGMASCSASQIPGLRRSHMRR
jgi:hypothetical protein